MVPILLVLKRSQWHASSRWLKIVANAQKLRFLKHRQTCNIRSPNPKTWMFLFSSCSCLWPIHWSQVLSREWRCSGGITDRRCSNHIWVINNFIAYWVATYIRGLTVYSARHVLIVICKKYFNTFYILHELQFACDICDMLHHHKRVDSFHKTKTKLDGVDLSNSTRCANVL